MIIANGTIEAKVKTPGGIDIATGYPKANTETGWATPVPCQWHAVTRDNLGRTVSGNFTLASYSVLIEQPRTPFTAEQVRLKGPGGSVIGEFSVINTEELDAVRQTRIMLK